MKLAILYGLKTPVKKFPKEDPESRILGTFSSVEAAVDYVNLGGLSPEFPYYGVCQEEGAFWVVAYPADTMPSKAGFAKWHAPGARPVILAGPFESPGLAQREIPWINRSGYQVVEVQCTSTKWSRKCARAVPARLIRPDLDWAEVRLPEWRRAAEVGYLGSRSIALSESGAALAAVSDWLDSGLPGTDPAYEARLLTLGKRVRATHDQLHELVPGKGHQGKGEN